MIVGPLVERRRLLPLDGQQSLVYLPIQRQLVCTLILRRLDGPPVQRLVDTLVQRWQLLPLLSQQFRVAVHF